jgi:hypothetical protein
MCCPFTAGEDPVARVSEHVSVRMQIVAAETVVSLLPPRKTLKVAE